MSADNVNADERDARARVCVLIRSAGRPELQQALASLVDQTWRAIEVKIVDVAGKGAIAIPEDYPLPVEVLSDDHALARSAAANRLLGAVQGDFALFLDDDDWLGPDHVERLVNALQAAPGSVLAYSGVSCVQFDEAAEDWHEVRRFDDAFDAVRLMVENYIPIHAALFRAGPLKADPDLRFDTGLDLFEDWDFWLRLRELGNFVHVPGVSAYYRVHGDSGFGFQTGDEAAALIALDHVIGNWWGRWGMESRRALIGWARHVPRLQLALSNLESDRGEVLARLHEVEAGVAELTQSYEARLVEAQERHAKELADLRAWYENSRSWRITRPLRRGAEIVRELRDRLAPRLNRSTLARGVLEVLMRVYRTPALSFIARRVPVPLKRRIRNRLVRAASPVSAVAAEGFRVSRALGDKPRVSIVVPVYNHSAYLEQCLRSALSQSWENLEIVVVDDASSEPEVEQILARTADDARVVVHRRSENGGICAAQNDALRLSSGHVIGFLDCDDYLEPDAVERCMRHWRDDTVYLHSGRVNVDEAGREVNRINFVSLPREDYFSENLAGMYATHFKLIRRDAFAKVGLFDPRFDSAQDYEMLMRIAFHYPSTSFLHVPDFVYYHRLHSGQTTERARQRQDELTQTIRREANLRDAIRRGEYGRFISIIMLSFGKHSQTLKAIEGLKRTVNVPHEIVLYDNGSSPETVTFIKENVEGRFEGVKVVYGERNLGPAQGRRAALGHASGEWFIVFDNDEVPEAGWLEELLLRAEANADVGAVCCRVAFPDERLQFSGGEVHHVSEELIELGLSDRGLRFDDLASCEFREVGWTPIGATLFTVNIAEYLHEGYPNVFEDAGVSFALKRRGLRLLNAPGALVWHEHITFRPDAEMKERYLSDRYNPEMMLKSVASFYQENALLIRDEYVWRENGLFDLTRDELIARLNAARQAPTSFG